MDKIKRLNCEIETLKSLFLEQAKKLATSVEYKPPLTPEEAWGSFYEQYLQG